MNPTLVCVLGVVVWALICSACAAWILRPQKLDKNWFRRTNPVELTHTDGSKSLYCGSRECVTWDWADVREVREKRK